MSQILPISRVAYRPVCQNIQKVYIPALMGLRPLGGDRDQDLYHTRTVDDLFKGLELNSTKYISEKGYTDIKTLVAFSGTVIDPDVEGKSYTEMGMNSISERELPAYFTTPEYQVLIVAEKYQTGYDQPLLKAVQTLSRLNRTTSGKVDTFVLDFANEIDEIKEAFTPYYEQTEIDEPTDPNHLYTLEAKIKQEPVLRDQEIDEFAKIYFKPYSQQTKRDHGQLNKWIDPAAERFLQAYQGQHEEEGELFKSTLQSFVRLYGFLSQIINWQDINLEKLYVYGRYLLTKLPRRTDDNRFELDGEVELSYYRNEKIFTGSGALPGNEITPISGPSNVGTATTKDDTASPLSSIIEVINERFGTSWTEEDKSQMTEERLDSLERKKPRYWAGAFLSANYFGLSYILSFCRKI